VLGSSNCPGRSTVAPRSKTSALSPCVPCDGPGGQTDSTAIPESKASKPLKPRRSPTAGGRAQHLCCNCFGLEVEQQERELPAPGPQHLIPAHLLAAIHVHLQLLRPASSSHGGSSPVARHPASTGRKEGQSPEVCGAVPAALTRAAAAIPHRGAGAWGGWDFWETFGITAHNGSGAIRSPSIGVPVGTGEIQILCSPLRPERRRNCPSFPR